MQGTANQDLIQTLRNIGQIYRLMRNYDIPQNRNNLIERVEEEQRQIERLPDQGTRNAFKIIISIILATILRFIGDYVYYELLGNQRVCLKFLVNSGCQNQPICQIIRYCVNFEIFNFIPQHLLEWVCQILLTVFIMGLISIIQMIEITIVFNKND